MTMQNIVFIAIALVLAITATVLAFVFIVPEKRREKLGAFGKFLHDACTFKFLLVEKILQGLYIFSTAFVILYGVFLLFNVEYSYWGGTHWTSGMGLLFIFLGPVLIRLSYELMMVVILLLKNVISINRKLADQTGASGADVFLAPDMAKLREEARQQHTAQEAAPQRSYCRVCGTELVDGVCPKCPPQYCKLCGTQLVNGVCPKCSAPTDHTTTQE